MSQFVEHLHEVFCLFGPLQARKMFGGFGIYHQGVMIGLVANDVLYLKTDAQTAPAFTERGCQPFVYTKNGVCMTMSYASAPDEIFDEPESARVWAVRALEAARRARLKAPRRTPRQPSSAQNPPRGTP